MILLEIYKTLEKPHTSKYGGVVQNLIFINIIINIIVAFSNEVFSLGSDTLHLFHIIEYITVGIFVFELICRYIVIGSDSKYKGFKGRVSYTFTPFIVIDMISLLPYLISGIHTDILLARLVRFLRFFRILKLLRIKDTVKNFFSISAFATSSVFVQFIVLFLFSIFFITLFSLVYSGDKTSLLIFLDPPSLAEAETNTEMTFGVIELIFGLIIGGTLISIITELLNNISNDIKKGFYPFKDNGHIVIINDNDKLEFILTEINHYSCDNEEIQDVVLFLPFKEDIEGFSQNIRKYSNLKISFIAGEELNWNSYKRLNINEAQKVMILENDSSDINYLNVKITKFILSHEEFKNESLEFVIEAENYQNINTVYDEIFYDKPNSYVLIEHNNIIQKVLNRSIIEPDYFKVFSNLLSYEDYEFRNMKASLLIDDNISFIELYLQFNEGILVGIIRNNTVMLNPNINVKIDVNDELIILQKDKFDYSLINNQKEPGNHIKLNSPKMKVDRKVCIIGDYDDIKEDQIVDFLDDSSIKNIQQIVLDSSEAYLQTSFWDEIANNKYDTVILNMEDDFELVLTMQLRNQFRDNTHFLDSLINIIHDPTIAKMLMHSKSKNNIILSERLVGKYITQVAFNKKVIDIFDELTSSYGSEFYVLDRQDYQELFDMSYYTFKSNLLKNNMIYIGAIKDGDFIVNLKELTGCKRIVVIANGY